MDEKTKNIQKQIAKLLFENYVINDKYAGVQMPDGKYVCKKIRWSVDLIYNMLVAKSSLGVYQQKYCTNSIKWICLDFDCADLSELSKILENYIRPAALKLEKLNVNFLAEFSGRRGVHLWINFKGTISKNSGYEIVEKILKIFNFKKGKNEFFNLDVFPATSRGSAKLGKQVKLPLSKHKKGSMSFFISDIKNSKIDDWIKSFEKENFWETQLNILQKYEKNDTEKIFKIFNINPDAKEKNSSILYKKEFLLANKKLTLQEIQKKCKNCKVIQEIINRAIDGNLRYLDRLVLSGCFFKNENFLVEIMQNQKNYNPDLTQKYINAAKGKYYPVTLAYLYDLYNEEIEKDLDPNQTMLSYLAEKLGLQNSIFEIKKQDSKENAKNSLSFFEIIREKELNYMRYNDEVVGVLEYLKIKNLKQYDFELLKEKFENIISKPFREDFSKNNYTIYKRWEENKENPRYLVSLSAQERILTTALVFELAKEANLNFNSYSYNLNFFDCGSVFIPWFSGWQNFQQEVENYLNLEFFQDCSLIKIDLKNYYDSIYLHSLYKQMGNLLFEKNGKKDKIKNIFDFFCSYTENLMKNARGTIRGIPQGPAYARVLSELFLSAIIKEFEKKQTPKSQNYKIMRYVDDIYVAYEGKNPKNFLQEFCDHIEKIGLKINAEKTVVFERIGDMTNFEKESIFNTSKENYLIKSIQDLELEEEEEQKEKIREFEKYLARKGAWSINDANFILNRHLDPIFTEQYLSYYGEKLIEQKIGRGSIYQHLYREIFSREKWFEKFFSKQLYKKIPPNSLNFKNFLSVSYFKISKIFSLKQEQIFQFVKWLDELNDLENDEKSTICAIKDLINDEKRKN